MPGSNAQVWGILKCTGGSDKNTEGVNAVYQLSRPNTEFGRVPVGDGSANPRHVFNLPFVSGHRKFKTPSSSFPSPFPPPFPFHSISPSIN